MPAELFKPGERRVGRAVGTPNKLTTYVRNVLAGAFAHCGGEEAFFAWAKSHPTHFYTKLWIKLLPDSSQLSDDEREKVLDAMLGVQKVITQLYTGESEEKVIDAQITQESQSSPSPAPSGASTNGSGATISPSPDSNPAQPKT